MQMISHRRVGEAKTIRYNYLMAFQTFIIQEKRIIEPTVIIIRVYPQASAEIFPFRPGQYVKIRNPKYTKKDEEHFFSIASSPKEMNYLEFCVRQYGNWTQAFFQLQEGDVIEIDDPMGTFTWDDKEKNVVFLVGGTGISPVMSMLRYLRDTNSDTKVTMIYGSRNRVIVYKDELDQLEKDMKDFRVVHILSEAADDKEWRGYHGFITRDIIEKEINFTQKPTFFLTGPSIFIDKMVNLLLQMGVNPDKIKNEKV